MANIGIGAGVGLSFKAIHRAIGTSGGTQSSFDVKRDLLLMGKDGARSAIIGGNFVLGAAQSAGSNAAQNVASDKKK